jgi:hypothetical protein
MKLAGLSVPQTDTISQAHPCRSRKVRINSVQLILLADDRTHFLVAILFESFHDKLLKRAA